MQGGVGCTSYVLESRTLIASPHAMRPRVLQDAINPEAAELIAGSSDAVVSAFFSVPRDADGACTAQQVPPRLPQRL